MSKAKKKKRGSLAISAFGLVLAVGFLGYAVSTNTPALFAQAAENSLAAASVSVNAGVAPNPDNTLAQQLQAKEQQLDAEQQQVTQVQQAEDSPSALFGSLGFYSLLASIALFLLVAMNFYFDWRRGRKSAGTAARPLSVDLRPGK